MKIRSGQLTTCGMANDGSNVQLAFLDISGAKVTVELPLGQAQVLVMTLPHLLTRALQQSTGDRGARYVFDLGGWALEATKDRKCLLATLKTTDGFDVCFGIPFEAGRSLGWNLQCGADAAPDAAATDEAKSMRGNTPARLN